MDTFPKGGYMGRINNFTDVVAFIFAHGASGSCHIDTNARTLENLTKSLRWGAATVIHYGSCPIKYHCADWANVTRHSRKREREREIEKKVEKKEEKPYKAHRSYTGRIHTQKACTVATVAQLKVTVKNMLRLTLFLSAVVSCALAENGIRGVYRSAVNPASFSLQGAVVEPTLDLSWSPLPFPNAFGALWTATIASPFPGQLV